MRNLWVLITRFPEDDLLSCFSVLSMRPLTFLTGAQLNEYGNKEIQKLCDFYGVAQTLKWKEDGVEKDSTPYTSQLYNGNQFLLK